MWRPGPRTAPFDFQNQSLLYLPKEMPDSYDPSYTRRLIELATPVLKLTEGRAFILFTSHRALEEAANLLSGVIDYPLLIQGDAPRHQFVGGVQEPRQRGVVRRRQFLGGG